MKLKGRKNNIKVVPAFLLISHLQMTHNGKEGMCISYQYTRIEQKCKH